MAHGESSGYSRGHGRSLASPGNFANDDGSPDWAIREAPDTTALVEALRVGRVMVAVVATADEVEVVHGRAVDKTSAMSVVSMVAKDGRRGLLAFTGIDALQAWDSSARPVPVSGVDAALAALTDDCEGLVLDVAGPRMHVVPEVDVLQIAGVDQVDHARAVAHRLLVEALDSDRVSVTRSGDRLQVATDLVDARDLAAMIPPRVLALVPAGVEIVDWS
jgi:hypothetical protein